MALLLLLLSLLHITAALPLHEPRAYQKFITVDEYVAYLQEYFPDTDKYLLYSGNSQKQLENFQELNPGYSFYADFFLGHKHDPDHPWHKAFNNLNQKHDVVAASRAIARVATQQIMIFGAIEYKTKGRTSLYTLHEYPIIKQRIAAGELRSIIHMARDAEDPSDIMAKEDGNGRFTWASGYGKGSTNASPEPDPSDDDEPLCTRKRDFLSFVQSAEWRYQCCSGILCWVAAT